MSSSPQSPNSSTKGYSSSYSTYSSSSNKTITRDGKPETFFESVESSNSSSLGEPLPPSAMGQFSDDFEELKRSVTSGDAYKRSQRIQSDIFPKPGQQRYKPQEGVTVIRPMRATTQNTAVPSTPPLPKSSSLADAPPLLGTPTITHSRIQRHSLPPSTTNGKTSVSPPMMSNYKTELYIPVRRHHGDFDDFFKSRWLEQNNAVMDTEFDQRRNEWETKLDSLKRDFFHFSPFSDHHPHIESANTVQPPATTISVGPTGNPEFAVRFDVKDFKPEEINVSTKGGKLTISATHEEKSGNSTSRREFKRTVDVPTDVQIGLMRSTLSKDGILSITAPIRPPNYLAGAPCAPPAIQSSSHVTQQHAKALSTLPSSTVVTRESGSGDALNYSLSIAGYEPEEVTVTVEGRKVKVHAKHDESTGGRKVHNEMTKSFDLPPTVDAHHVRSYIKDGSTLFIEAHLRDNLVGKIHLVPVTHK